MMITGTLIRWALGALFILAGALKLMDPAAFAWNIYQYGLLPRVLVGPFAMLLPVTEIVSGGALMVNRRWSYGAAGGLLVLFIAVLGYAIINGLNVDCKCFGAGEPGPAGLRKAFLRDAVMLIGLWFAWRSQKQRPVQGRTDTLFKEDAS